MKVKLDFELQFCPVQVYYTRIISLVCFSNKSVNTENNRSLPRGSYRSNNLRKKQTTLEKFQNMLFTILFLFTVVLGSNNVIIYNISRLSYFGYLLKVSPNDSPKEESCYYVC